MREEKVQLLKSFGKPLLLVLSGGLCFWGVAYISDQTDLWEKLNLDVFGRSVVGVVDNRPAGNMYRLSYRDETGAIYARLYSGWLGPQSLWQQDSRVHLRQDKRHPRKFQPAGVSIVPGLSCFGLLAVGLFLLSSGRRRLLQNLRQRALDRGTRKPTEGSSL